MNSSQASIPMVIECPSCHNSLSASPEIVGQTVECVFCKHHFVVTAPPSPFVESSAPAITSVTQAELESLEGQLRENVSQITELRGHVSRLNMELHRYELRMKKLTERNTELQAQIGMAKKANLA